MGLDMYLYLKRYESVTPWEEGGMEKKKGFYPKELNGLGEGIFKRNFMSKETSCQVGYWRKANAIHKWFVDECAKGVDDCRPVYVSEEKLRELLGLVNETLADPTKASALLPTQDGFFFGSTEYSEWYKQDLEYTRDLLKEVLAFLKDKDYHWSVIYKASW